MQVGGYEAEELEDLSNYLIYMYTKWSDIYFKDKRCWH